MTSRTPLQQSVAKSLVGGGVLALAVGLASIVGCTASTPAAPTGTARVERVADGDTVVLRGGSRVRLVQVDAPELGQGECYGAASRRVLGRLVQVGARVELEADPGLDQLDRYGRLLRYVHMEDENVNVELVRLGAATPYFRHGERGRYADLLNDANKNARDARRGMWSACQVSWRPDRQVETRPR